MSFSAFFWAVLGNIIPVIFILWFLKAISDFLSHRFYHFNRFFAWLLERTRRNHSKKFERWKEFALVILVAIPLPFTGAWTGALAAFVFGIRKLRCCCQKALPAMRRIAGWAFIIEDRIVKKTLNSSMRVLQKT